MYSGAFILSLRDGNKLYHAFFSWDASAKIRDEFNIEVVKFMNRAMFKLVILDLSRSMKNYMENFAHVVTLLYHKL